MNVRSSDPYRVRVLRDSNGVASVRFAWEKLQWHPNADIDYFLLINSLRKQEPYVVVVSQGEDVLAIAAARLVTRRHECSIGYKTVYAPQVRELMLIHGGLMGNLSGAVAGLVLEGLTSALTQNVADVLSMSHVRADSPLYALATHYRPFVCRDFSPRSQAHYELVLPESADGLFAKLKSKHRSELRRLPKVLEKNFPGQVRIQCFESAEDVVPYCSDAEMVASKSYLRALRVGFVDGDEVRQMVSLYAQRGAFVGYMMYIQDKPCAFWSAELYGDVCYLASTAFDPQYHKFEIGTILLVHLIEDFMERKPQITRVDFGLGEARYKIMFSTGYWEEISLFLFAPTIRGLSVNLIRTPLLATKQFVQNTLKRFHWEEKLKGLWRRQARQKLEQ